MANERGKLFNSQGEYQKLGADQQAASGYGRARVDGQHLDEKRHERGYNPIEDAERCSISEKLNGDAGRYRKGPGPL